MSLVKSVFKVFDGKQKRKLFGMAFLILINSGVSLLGVSVLLPFIQAVKIVAEKDFPVRDGVGSQVDQDSAAVDDLAFTHFYTSDAI